MYFTTILHLLSMLFENRSILKQKRAAKCTIAFGSTLLLLFHFPLLFSDTAFCLHLKLIRPALQLPHRTVRQRQPRRCRRTAAYPDHIALYLPRHSNFSGAALVAAFHTSEPSVNKGMQTNLRITRFQWLNAQDIAVIKLSYASEGIMIEGHHIIAAHFAFINGAVRPQGIPPLPCRRGPAVDLIEPARTLFVQEQNERR